MPFHQAPHHTVGLQRVAWFGRAGLLCVEANTSDSTQIATFWLDLSHHNYYSPTAEGDFGSLNRPRINCKTNTTIIQHYYLKELSGSFIRRSPPVPPSINNNSIFCQVFYGDNAQLPNNNYNPPPNKCNNTSPEKNCTLSESLTLSDVDGESSSLYN